jgi:hypothetical protein
MCLGQELVTSIELELTFAHETETLFGKNLLAQPILGPASGTAPSSAPAAATASVT